MSTESQSGPIVQSLLKSGQFHTADAAASQIESIDLSAPVAEDVAATSPESQDIQQVEQKPEEKKEQDPFSAKFAALSRKEKQLRDRERQVETRLKELEGQLAEKSQGAEALAALEARIKNEPLAVLEEKYGLSFQQLAEMALNDGRKTMAMQMTEREKEVQAKIDALEKRIQEKEAKEQQERYDATMTSFKNQINEHIANKDTLELVRANDAADLVYQVIEEHHAATGEILPIERAAEAVEDHLLAEAKRHLELNKIKALLQPSGNPQIPQQEKSVAKPATKTLSNALSAQATQAKKQLSDDDSKIEASKLIRWID